MSDWRFSLRATGAWLSGGVVASLCFGVALNVSLARPLIECLVLAIVCLAITNSGGLVEFSLETPQGDLAPMAHPAAFVAACIVALLAGALMGWLYWSLATGGTRR